MSSKKQFCDMNDFEKVEYIFKNHIIKSVVIINDDENNFHADILFGDSKVKKSEFQILKEMIVDIKDTMNTKFDEVNTKINSVSDKLDDVVVAVKELQSEASKHNWNINHKL